MKLYSIIIFKQTAGKPITLSITNDLSSVGFFQRSHLAEVLLFASREVVQRTHVGGSESVLYQGQVCHSRAYSDFAAAVTCDEEYPWRVALNLIQEAMVAFRNQYGTSQEVVAPSKDLNLSCSGVAVVLKKYSNPIEADKILRAQKDIDDTKQILLKSIDQLLERGEKLDDLVAKTEDLSMSTQTFMKQSKKMNRCCTIL